MLSGKQVWKDNSGKENSRKQMTKCHMCTVCLRADQVDQRECHKSEENELEARIRRTLSHKLKVFDFIL